MSSLGGASATSTYSISGTSSLKTTQTAPKPALSPLVPSPKQKTAFQGLSLSNVEKGLSIAEVKRVESRKRSLETRAGTAGMIEISKFSGSRNLFRSRNLIKTFAQTTPRPEPQTIRSPQRPDGERIFFDGGAHYGDLLANLIFGFSLVWMPLTIAAVFRAFFLRYRFTNLRVTVISGLTGSDRSDFSYEVIKDVQVIPRFIGEWGDVVITLTDGTKVDLRSVPKFREIADYCLYMADQTKKSSEKKPGRRKGF